MRKTFLRAGFLKEAHYRLAWPTNDGGRVASIAYSILRQDWENGTLTHFDGKTSKSRVPSRRTFGLRTRDRSADDF